MNVFYRVDRPETCFAAEMEYTDTVTNIKYKYDPDITLKTAYVSDGKRANDSVVIPETVNINGTDYTVTEIRSYAFYKCSSLDLVNLLRYSDSNLRNE